MINASNSDQRRAASLNLCDEIFSSAMEHAEELEYNIDVILQDQDLLSNSQRTICVMMTSSIDIHIDIVV